MQNGDDFVVVGGGIVGASVAYGLLRAGRSVTLLDGTATNPRASVANFGLVWVQGKGPQLPAYQVLTREASDLWPQFHNELMDVLYDEKDLPVMNVAYQRDGGLTFCLSDEEFTNRANYLNRLHNQSGGLSNDCEMIDRAEIERLMPKLKLGKDVVGGSFCWRDGCVNPLNLYTALLSAIRRLKGVVRTDAKVERIEKVAQCWKLTSASGFTLEADNIVLTAGLDNERLSKMVGLYVPVMPQRGQILVSERRQQVMKLPASTIRQTTDGTFLIGATKEDVGLDTSHTVEAAQELAERAIRILPELENINVVRQWSGLRIMTPDGAPIYEFGDNAAAISCHSGITLSPIHATHFVDEIIDRSSNYDLTHFRSSRFNESQNSSDRPPAKQANSF